jgi:hypothetical protein
MCYGCCLWFQVDRLVADYGHVVTYARALLFHVHGLWFMVQGVCFKVYTLMFYMCCL